MANNDPHLITPLHHIPLNYMRNKDSWCVSDLSLQSLDKIVLSGCKQKSKKTFINVFSIDYENSNSKPKSFYSREFNKKYSSELWRLVSVLDDSHLVTCFDDLAEKISITKDKTVQSWKLPQGGASCISVKEREVFIGFHESCDVVVLNSNLRHIRTITVDALQDGWPVDLVVVPDALLLCSVGCVPRTALAVGEKDGQLLREYTNPQSDDSVPLSLTVSADCDLVAILWNSPPQLTIHSFHHGNCLVIANVEPAERIRNVGQDKLVLVDEQGELEIFLMEHIFTFNDLKTILSLLLSDSDCSDIRDLLGMSCDQNDKTECSDAEEQVVKNEKFLTSLEESHNISPGNVTTLLEALQELDKNNSLIHPVEAYQKYSACHKGRKRSRNKSPRGRKDDLVKRKKNTKDSTPKSDEAEGCITGEEGEPSDTNQDVSSTDDTDKEMLSPSPKQRTPREQDTLKSLRTGLNGSSSTPQLSEEDATHEKDTEDVRSSGDEDSEEVVMETEPEEDVIMAEGEPDQRSSHGPTLKERMATMLEEIQALKQQNEVILSILRTQPNLYPQQYSCTHQCLQHPPILQSIPAHTHHIDTTVQANSQPQVLAHAIKQTGLMPTAQPSNPTQSQPPTAVQPSLASLPSQSMNPPQPTHPVTVQPQMQLASLPGSQIPPCTCKVPPPAATDVLTQPPTASVPQVSSNPSCHQPSNIPLPATPASKPTSQTSTSSTPTQVQGPPPAQQAFNTQQSYPPAFVPVQPNPHVTFQPPMPVYTYPHPFVPSYISGTVPTGSHIQFVPYPSLQQAPSLSQGQPATNLPTQVPSQTASMPSVLPTTPSVPVSLAPSTNAQVPPQPGTIAGLLPTPSPASNMALTPNQQSVFDQSSIMTLWQSLPVGVQVEISPLKGSHDPKSRDKIARRLIRHYFPSEVRIKSNCAGVFGYAALDPEKLYYTRCLTFYLCPLRSGGAEAETREWKRLIKIIDAYNRSHRKYTNSKLTLMNAGSDQASVESEKK